LNKTDLVDESRVQKAERLIQQVNPAAPIYRTVRGNVDLGLIMGVGAFTAPPQFKPTNASHNHDDCKEDHPHDHSSEPTHYELRGISSLQVSCPTLDQTRFDLLDEWIRSVLWESKLPDSGKEVQVLRCKGLIALGTGEHYVLQGVRSMYDMSKLQSEEESVETPEAGKIVLIGKGLDDAVRKSLEKVLQRA
jgi:G3E family GTPase